jgi:hypothetical protein
MTIKFTTNEEFEFAQYYANNLNDHLSADILNRGEASNKDEAEHISHFFWSMVDAAIIDEQNQHSSLWSESPQIICEKIMYSLSAHLENNGFSTIWERVSDERNA